MIPVWICAVVGAGLANPLPGVLAVAAAAISPAGTVPRWQLSQVVDDGMWDPLPTGLVAGMPTIRVMPAKLVLDPAGKWQDEQALAIPAWLMREPENLAPLATGVAAIDDPEPTWQTSQDAVVGMWVAGRPTMLKPAAGMANDAAALPWHWAQLLLVLGALAWIAATVGWTE